jgi:hypothetical protein
MQPSSFKNRAVALVAIFLIIGSFSSSQNSQPTPEIATRDLWDSNLMSKRPPRTSKKVTKGEDEALLGVTLWKLRPARSADNPAVRSLIQEDDQTREWTPERIRADTPLREGDRVRISLESARTGYLYVVDSDLYGDGTRGNSYLIFPTLRIRGGNNSVGAGTLVEIPSQEDAPPYFRMRRSRPDQSVELLTIFVSPAPIEHLQIGSNRLLMSADQIAQWKKQCACTSAKLESPATAGLPYTLAEKAAGNSEKKLTQHDPLPQTMYRVDAKLGKPLFVELQLQVGP